MNSNPQKNEKAEIIIGIPSYNEAEKIAFVVKQISKGLKKYFPNKPSLIVNVDNNSTDATKEVFLKTKSSVPKIYLSTRAGIKGKGYNFYNLFNFIKERSSEINIVVDADLKSISPEWIRKMAMPVVRGCDFVIPVYTRNKRDALITNHFCYPLLYGLLGWDIAQPIGGDFAFSQEMVQHWLSKKWPAPVYQYGIDIFMTTEAILNDFKVCQVDLGRKVHRPTKLRLKSMFIEIGTTLFNQLVTYKRFWQTSQIKRPEIFYKKPVKKPQPLTFDPQSFHDIFQLGFQANKKILKRVLTPGNYQLLRQLHQSKRSRIKAELWSRIVYDFLNTYETFFNKKKLIEILEILAFGRFFSHIKLTKKLNFKQAKKEIINQAKIFRKNREYLLSKYKES